MMFPVMSARSRVIMGSIMDNYQAKVIPYKHLHKVLVKGVRHFQGEASAPAGQRNWTFALQRHMGIMALKSLVTLLLFQQVNINESIKSPRERPFVNPAVILRIPPPQGSNNV